ncbi:MAG: aminotransferase class III-fold pyridoxal phosphate-dependent enzyme [Bacteroidota bacterium]
MNLFDVYPLYDFTPTHARGAYVYDEAGNEYLDFYGGHAVISIGHSHPHYVHRVGEQLSKLGFYSNSVKNPLQQELAHKLGQLSGIPDYQLFLCNSGAEATENALKMASFATGKTKIIAFEKGFHGRTSAAVNVTNSDKIKAPINRGFEVDFLPLKDLVAVEQALAQQDVCAVIIEGIQGIGGVHVPDPDFLEELAKLCKTHGAKLILDEIQSGFGRSGRFFAYQYANIEPDLITMAKGMGNGFPVGGLLLHPSFEASYGLLGTTFGGNHLACAAALAVLEVLASDDLMKNAIDQGAILRKELQTLFPEARVRGRGLMIGLEMSNPVKTWRRELLMEGRVFTGSSSMPNVLRLLPPLGIGPQEVNRFLQVMQSMGSPVVTV